MKRKAAPASAVKGSCLFLSGAPTSSCAPESARARPKVSKLAPLLGKSFWEKAQAPVAASRRKTYAAPRAASLLCAPTAAKSPSMATAAPKLETLPSGSLSVTVSASRQADVLSLRS